MPLFEVAVLVNPTKAEIEAGKGQVLALKPTAVVARDSQSAAIAAVLDNPTALVDVERSRMEVLVRPFA
jgi:hypothetical protein